jgi:transcriptional regulator with XRE-family HTH domain
VVTSDLEFVEVGLWSNVTGIYPTIVLMELKRVLRDLMTENNVKVAEVARATKVPVQSLHNWLGGMSPRNLDHVMRVAEYFKVTMDFLISGKQREVIKEFEEEINAGLFEVVLRRPKKVRGNPG